MQTCPSLTQLPSLRGLLPDAEIRGADDVCLGGCTCDCRRVEPGHLFAAFEGSRHDGHDFIAEAIARGCAAVLTDRPLAHISLPENPVPVCTVPHAREAYARICQALAGNPSEKLSVIGITGTNGKTTTGCLVAGILTTAGYRVGLTGSLGYLDGKKIETSSLTTPPAEVLADWLARMVRNECTHAIVEVSSHGLDQARVAGIRMDAACVTNVTRDHLDYHGTLGHYRRTKAKLFDHLSDHGFAVINADDPVAASYLREFGGPALTVGIDTPGEIRATLLEQQLHEQTFLLTAGSETIPVRTEMIGIHHVRNCLVAAAVGLTYGIDLPTVVRGLETTGQVPGRLERIDCGQPFRVFVDHAHTPHALSGSLETLRALCPGRLICVFGAGGDRDHEKRPLMGRAVEAVADLSIVTSDNPRGEDPLAIIREILTGFAHPGSAEVIADRADAIHRALAAAKPGDCVLIAGKGHETHQIIGQQRIPFDDREVAREWLYRTQPHAVDANRPWLSALGGN